MVSTKFTLLEHEASEEYCHPYHSHAILLFAIFVWGNFFVSQNQVRQLCGFIQNFFEWVKAKVLIWYYQVPLFENTFS